MEKQGGHAFRRFRVTWLRKDYRAGLLKHLETFWLRHKPALVRDLYSALTMMLSFTKPGPRKSALALNFRNPWSPESNSPQLASWTQKTRLKKTPKLQHNKNLGL